MHTITIDNHGSVIAVSVSGSNMEEVNSIVYELWLFKSFESMDSVQELAPNRVFFWSTKKKLLAALEKWEEFKIESKYPSYEFDGPHFHERCKKKAEELYKYLLSHTDSFIQNRQKTARRQFEYYFTEPEYSY